MEVHEEKPLIAPENCPPVEYIINGFTKTDASYVVAAGVVGAILGIILWVKGGNSIAGVTVFFAITVVALSVIRRNAYTENLIDKIRIYLEYRNAQKKYEYRSVNTLEMRKKNAGEGKRK